VGIQLEVGEMGLVNSVLFRRAFVLCVLSILALADFMWPAAAQAVLMEEIVVEAQRREELVQDVPIAVTAYNSDQLDQLQVTETLDMTRLVPNMVGHNNTGLGTANTYALRGLSNTESVSTFDPPVGSYVDDIYVSRQNANNFTLFDVDRIEVLRGPQGTLFGRNTTGGAVVVRMAKPREELGGYVEAGVGSYDRYALRGSIDVPITQKILTKLSAYWIEDDGFVDQINFDQNGDQVTVDDSINKEENWGVRGAARFLFTDNFLWDISLEYTDESHANLLNYKNNSSRITNTGIRQNSSNLTGLLTGNKQNYPLGNDTKSFGATSRFDWTVGSLGTLSFITGWRDLDQDFALDFCDNRLFCNTDLTATPSDATYGAFTIANEGKHEQFSQEIKWAGSVGSVIDYVGGFFYIDEDNTTDFGDIFNFDLGGGEFPFVLADRVMTNSTESWAVYAQGDWHITDKWTVTAGVRYTDEDKEVGYSDNAPSGDASDLTTANMVALGIPVKQTESIWTPRFAVQFAPTDDQMYYASATRGFKSGGWNARGTTPDTLLPFTSEVVWNYEVGAKTDWLNDTLRVNLTGFYMDVSDFQLPAARTTPIGSIEFITGNFADLNVLGLELEVISNPIDNLTLWANLGIMDGDYENIDQRVADQAEACRNGDAASCNAGIVNPDGNIAPPVRIPDYTLNLGGNYVWSITEAFELVPGAYLYSVGDHSVGTSGAPVSLVDGYTTYNASLALNAVNQGWSVIAECKNCNDRTMVVSTLAGFQYLQDPRTWMLRLNWNFGANK